jgi:hypothetical protein
LNSEHKKHETIRNYLLGQATPEDSSWLEEQLLTDAALFQELLIAEDELVDQYLSDKLSPTELQSFEAHFLAAPERQRKLRFSRAFHRYVDLAGTSELEDSAEYHRDEKPAVANLPPKKSSFSFLPFSNPIVSYALAGAMLLIVAGVSWVAFNNWRKQTPPQPGNVYVVSLTPGLTRDSGELKRVTIPGKTDSVQLQLILPDTEYQKYKVELQSSEGRTIQSQDNLAAQLIDGSRKVVVPVPAKLLPVGDYQLRLSGVDNLGQTEPLSRYYFRVVRP